MNTRKNPIGLIAAPDAVVLAMQDRLLRRPQATHRVWPFRFMQVGDEVVFAAPRAKTAMSMAHAYAERSDILRFQCRTREDGQMYIARTR